MNLDQVKDLSYRDASLYFDKCIAVHREEPRTCVVSIQESSTYGWAVRRGDETLDPEQFWSEWEVCRFQLGWRNIGKGAVYLYCPVGRSALKGYSTAHIQSFSPYENVLVKKKTNLHIQFKDKVEQDKNIKPDTLVSLQDQLCKDLQYIDSKIHAGTDRLMKSTANRTKAAFPTYVSRLDAINTLGNKNVTGVALANSIALVLDGLSDHGGPTLYYHKVPIGEVKDEQLNCYDEYQDMVPQITRILGEQHNE